VDETPAQTVGPFLHLALADPALRDGVGADDGAAVTLRGTVVDGAGAVRGYERLFVCDASVFPDVPASGTYVPTVLVAERLTARWRRSVG
jgi:hypothetical protein